MFWVKNGVKRAKTRQKQGFLGLEGSFEKKWKRIPIKHLIKKEKCDTIILSLRTNCLRAFVGNFLPTVRTNFAEIVR